MKTLLSILLVICMCLTVLAACDNALPGNETPGTTQGKNNNSSIDSAGNTESSESTEGTGTSDNTNNNGSNNDTTGGNSTQGNDVKGERITEDQFNNLKNNPPVNYTYTEVRTYNGKTESITMEINGEEYIETIYLGETFASKSCGILADGKIKNYLYNADTGKWESSNTGKHITYPLEGFPIALSDFTFDEATGTYQYSMTVEGATAQLHLGFKDGNCVYLAQFSGENQSVTTFCNYGTTLVAAPDPSDIIDSNTNQSNTNQGSSSDKH